MNVNTSKPRRGTKVQPQQSTKGNPQVPVRMPPTLLKAARKAAAAEDRSVSYLMRRELERWLKDNGYLPEINGRKD